MLTVIYVGNDTLLELDKLRRASTGAFINDATVTYAIKSDSSGAPGSTLSGGTGSLSYVTGSNGKYQGTIESSVTTTAGSLYWIEVTFSSGSLNGVIQEQVEAQRRGKRC